MIQDSYNTFFKEMEVFPRLQSLREVLQGCLDSAFDTKINGNLIKWLAAFERLPDISASEIDLNCSTPIIGYLNDLDLSVGDFETILQELIPWRKGPYNLFGVHLDTEWRSDFKWDRLKNHITDLQDRVILDIGCGNGYHCLRMVGAGAKLVVGVDPGMLSVIQFKVLQKYIPDLAVDVFPLGVEELPENTEAFDTVFSMGVIYHRKDPLEHLGSIASFLRPGGEIILETLVIDGDDEDILVPGERYAKMRNVWQIPSVLCAEQWLKKAGFCEIRTVDVTTTTTEEQRGTEWMRFHSLPEFLDPDDNSKTIEGYPAPKRAIIIGKK